ncbi:hypothetical protein JCM8097_005236 [Rhodosporidiobolus ruineniae]
MSTRFPQGQCCACGGPSTQRCSACLEAGFELFFCSQEHQKLVWFAHKLMCGMGDGKSSKPFRLPAITKHEARTLQQLEDYGEARDREKLACGLKRYLPAEWEKAGFPAVLKILTTPALLDQLHPSIAAAAIWWARQSAFAVFTSLHSPTGEIEDADVSLVTPRDSLTFGVGLFAQPLLDAAKQTKHLAVDLAFPVHDRLLIDYLHRNVILSALNSLDDSRTLSPAEKAKVPPRQHAVDEMRRAIDRLSSKFYLQGRFLQDQLKDVV